MSKHTLHIRIAQAIREHNLFEPDACLVVAVSGGADSLALLDLLTTLPCFSLRLIVAHLNHLLRGAESDADERLVRERAQQYHLPCEVLRVDVKQHAKQQKQSLEEAGRDARYAFFEKVRQHYQASAIVVAHHADDQAETFLLRLLRGAGTTGLAAMTPGSSTRVVRPLLEISSTELRRYLHERNLPFREDASNQDRSFLRNRVRHELLPLLESYGNGIAARLANTAQLLGQDEHLLVHYTNTEMQQHAQSGPGWTALPRSYLLEQPQALRMRLYRTVIAQALGDLRRFDHQHYALLDTYLQQGATGGRLTLPRGLVALLTGDHLLCAHRNILLPHPPATCQITAPGRYDLGNGLTILVESSPAPDDWHQVPTATTYVNPTLAPFPWEVRPALSSDRIEPLGMAGSCRVKDILIDAKLPRHLRPNLPLVLYHQQPLWLAGLKRSRLALVQAGQTSALRITLQGQKLLPLFP